MVPMNEDQDMAATMEYKFQPRLGDIMEDMTLAWLGTIFRSVENGQHILVNIKQFVLENFSVLDKL
jgi:hypothetical protein